MNYPLWDIFVTMLWFFVLCLWVFLVIWTIMLIFRRRDLSGWAKAAWLLFVIFIPLIGVLAYLVAPGRASGRRADQRAQRSPGRAIPRLQPQRGGRTTQLRLGEEPVTTPGAAATRLPGYAVLFLLIAIMGAGLPRLGDASLIAVGCLA
jgi:Phospholipase_D-nuclease N-terminal